MSGAALWQAYEAFGKGYCVVDRLGLLQFSAAPYAHKRCAELAPPPYAIAPRERLTIAQQEAKDREQAIVVDNEKRATGARRSLSMALWFLGVVPLVWATVKAAGLHSTAGEVLHGLLLFVGFWYFLALFWLDALVDRWFAPRR